MLDLFTADQQNQTDAASRSPIPTAGTTAGEAASAALDANLRGTGIFRESLNTYDAVQDELDRFQARTGERIENPVGLPAEFGRTLDQVRTRFAEKARELNDPSIAFPSDDALQQAAMSRAHSVMTRSERLSQGAQAFGAGVARFAGNAASEALNPLNALAVATIPEGGLAVKMLGAAVGFGGAALGTDLSTYSFNQRMDPEFGPGTVLKDTAEGAAIGAGFELGGWAIGKGVRYGMNAAPALWRRLKATRPAAADAMPTDLADAGNAAERAADLHAQNPFTGPEAEGAHTAAVVAVERDLLAGRVPELPPITVEPADTAAADLAAASRAVAQAQSEGRPLADVLHAGADFYSDGAVAATRLFADGDGVPLPREQVEENLQGLTDGLREPSASRYTLDVHEQDPNGTSTTYRVQDPAGREVGYVTVSHLEDNPEALYMHWAGRTSTEPDLSADINALLGIETPAADRPQNTLGPRVTRGVLRELSRLYPEATRIEGLRLTGGARESGGRAWINLPRREPIEQLRSALARGVDAEELAQHPAILEAEGRMRAIAPTHEAEGFGSPRWERTRTFDFGGERVQGYRQAIPRLISKAESYAGGQVAADRRAFLVIGPPAAGKSTIAERIARNERAAIVDPDDAKVTLPEYRGGLGANATHEESGILSDHVLESQLDRGHNIVIPKVGADAVKLGKLAEELRSEGYAVHLINMNVAPAEAFRRMASRFVNTGRLIPPDYFRSIGTRPTEAYNLLRDDARFTSHAEVDGNGPHGQQQPVTGFGDARRAVDGGRERGRSPGPDPGDDGTPPASPGGGGSQGAPGSGGGGGVAADPSVRASLQAATDPAAVQATTSAPTTIAAAEAGLQRAIARGRTAVPTIDDAGNAILGDARAELQAINDELAAARAIGGCNVPGKAKP